VVTRTLCTGFVRMTIRARLSLLDTNIGTSAMFYAYTLINHIPKCYVCSWHLYGYASATFLLNLFC